MIHVSIQGLEVVEAIVCQVELKIRWVMNLGNVMEACRQLR